jgi:uracil phosphoribosyltransferase
MLLCYEVTRDLPLEIIDIETPLRAMKAPQIAGKKLVFAPILRAGVGFLDGMLTLVPSARVAHIGLYRDPESLQAVEYYFKAPSDLADRTVLVLDPMLATANSAVAAIDRLKERDARDMRFGCLLAAPGASAGCAPPPDVPIWTAAIDERLNDHGISCRAS